MRALLRVWPARLLSRFLLTIEAIRGTENFSDSDLEDTELHLSVALKHGLFCLRKMLT